MRFRPVLLTAFIQFCVLAPLAVPLHALDADAIEERYKQAHAHEAGGRFQQALEIYNGIIEAEPGESDAWISRGIVKWRLKDKRGADDDLAQSIKLQPHQIDAFYVRAQFRAAAWDTEGALADARQALAVMDEMLAKLKADGLLTDLKNAPPEAIEKYAALYSICGRAQTSKDPAGAIRDFTRALELEPNLPDALFWRGRMHDELHEREAAIADYSRVIELTPDYPNAWSMRAGLRFEKQDWEGAISDARKTLELDPKWTSAYCVIGNAQFAKGDYQAAAATLTKAADASESVEESLFLRHYALLRTGGADQRLATTWAKWKYATWNQALAKYITGQLTEKELAAVAYDEALDGSGDHEKWKTGRDACQMHFYVGLTLRQAGDKSGARRRFQAAIATNQKDSLEYALASTELKRL